MENSYGQDQLSSLLDLSVDPSSQHSLEQSAKWARFLGIVLICSGVIIFLCMILAGSSMNRAFFRYTLASDPTYFMVLALVMLAIFSVYIVFLMRFSSLTVRGIRETNQSDLERGIASLKVYVILVAVYSMLVLLAGLFGLFF